MNYNEHLLVCLAEECTEVAHRVAKALRFGLNEVQSGKSLDNALLIHEEMSDLWSVYHMLVKLELVPPLSVPKEYVKYKKDRIEEYMEIARAHGTLT